jgi:parvulin-like peptidyl-prolyl isomerase
VDFGAFRRLPRLGTIAGLFLICLCLDLFSEGPVRKWVQPHFPGRLQDLLGGVNREWVATVAGHPITRAQLDLATGLFLARKDQAQASLPADALNKVRLAILDGLIDEELVRISSEAQPVHVPEEWLQERVNLFEARFAPGELARALAAQDLSKEGLRAILREHARQQFWLEEKTRALRKVSDEEAMSWYRARGRNVRMPEVIRARHLFLSSVFGDVAAKEKLLPELVSQLQSGSATFEQLCPRYSEDERTKLIGGELGYFSRERVLPDFAGPVFAQEPGKVGGAFRTKIGWHIVQVEEKIPARELSWEELRPEIAAYLENCSTKRVLDEFVSQLRKDEPFRVQVFPLNGEK